MKFLILISLLLISSILSKTETLTMDNNNDDPEEDCGCEVDRCSLCEIYSEDAEIALTEAQQNLQNLLLDRDQGENELLEIHDDHETREYELKCDILCSAEHLKEYNEQISCAVNKGIFEISNQFNKLVKLANEAISAQNSQLKFLGSFNPSSDPVTKDIKAILENIQVLQEQVYNLICFVQKVSFSCFSQVQAAIANENQIQSILERISHLVVDLFPSNLDQISNLKGEEVNDLLYLINKLQEIEKHRVGNLRELFEEIGDLRENVWNSLNEVSCANVDYYNTLENCEIKALMKNYKNQIKTVKECSKKPKHTCKKIDVPSYRIPALELPSCLDCSCEAVECIPMEAPEFPEFPKFFEVSPIEAEEPECAPYERCPLCPTPGISAVPCPCPSAQFY